MTEQRREAPDRTDPVTLEICWNRHVIVHNQPHAIDSPEARRPTYPQVGDVTASQCAFHVVEAMNECQRAVRRDVYVAHLVGDGPSIRSEEFLPGSTFLITPGVLQGRIEIE